MPQERFEPCLDKLLEPLATARTRTTQTKGENSAPVLGDRLRQRGPLHEAVLVPHPDKIGVPWRAAAPIEDRDACSKLLGGGNCGSITPTVRFHMPVRKSDRCHKAVEDGESIHPTSFIHHPGTQFKPAGI